MATIRSGCIEDVPIIHDMLRRSAEEQDFLSSLAVTIEDLAADGFGPQPRFSVAVAEWEGAPAGMALYFFNYSTWGSRNGLYLEDLYVKREYRKSGIARALLIHLAQTAVTKECGRFQWVVHRENAAAIALYESIGARILADWRLMSIAGEAIERLAHL